ncbi:MAG TPA: 4'-phosphopantetheinyl transferase superfamily protein [Steroidobacter sp.]
MIDLRSLVPPNVVVADSTSTPELALHPDEARFAEAMHPRRREQFMQGRACARQALRALEIENYPLLPDAGRAPIWPQGITGSITHTRGYFAAAVARQAEVPAVGIDAERISRITERLWRYYLSEREIEWLQAQDPGRRAALAAAMFSAKEAAYKCQYQLTHRSMHMISIELEIGPHSFRARVPAPGQPERSLLERIEGRFAWEDDLVISAALPA